jgi:hypothetical protein
MSKKAMWDSMSKKQKLIYDCANLSSGTMSTLTGLRKYDDLEKVQNEFIAYVKKSHTSYPNWATAWKAFKKSKVKYIAKKLSKIPGLDKPWTDEDERKHREFMAKQKAEIKELRKKIAEKRRK